MRRPSLALSLAAAAVILSLSCRQDMHDQPRYETFEASDFFADGRASRPLVAGTVPQGHLHENGHLFLGQVDGELARTFPMPVTRQLLQRGRERYAIFCTPCHGLTGDGHGMVVQRGFPAAASLHDERLRQEPVGYYFDVMTRGFGRMKDYAAQISAEDRWAITAYIQALQLSQNVPLDRLDDEDRLRLEDGGQP